MRIRRKITSAHLIALLALFVALGGTVYAAGAINGRSIRKGSIPANRLRANSLTGAQVAEEKLGTVPSARSASQADSAKHAAAADNAKHAEAADSAKHAEAADDAKHAGEADSAKHATAADNALALGGVPAGGYLRPCQNGTLKASVVVDTNLTTNEFVAFSGLNCGGGPIEVIRAAGLGEYFVKFVGGPGGITPPVPAVVSLATEGPAIAAKVRSVNNPFDGAPSFLVQTLSAGGVKVGGATFTLLAF
jgi:hypothetical protein